MMNGQLNLSTNYKTMCKRKFSTYFRIYPGHHQQLPYDPHVAVFTEIELGVICDVKPSAATVSMFMQLISAPESNKHENTYPPVSILNVVPLDLPVFCNGGGFLSVKECFQ